jgi:creatinine amidohydrolase
MTILHDTTWATVRERTFRVAVLPWGATEAHNYHLPYGTDVIEAASIGALAVKAAADRGAQVVLLPAIPFGVQTGQRDIPLCINMNPSTQAVVLRDVVTSLEPHGIRVLVILNGHGGNDFKQVIRELQPSTSLVLVQVNWYQVRDARSYFDDPGDHGGELETSVMLHLAPELVRPLHEAGPGAARPPIVQGMREGWAWTPRRWTQVTDDTGVGDPSRATADKGARYVADVTEALAQLFVELGNVNPDQLYA